MSTSSINSFSRSNSSDLLSHPSHSSEAFEDPIKPAAVKNVSAPIQRALNQGINGLGNAYNKARSTREYIFELIIISNQELGYSLPHMDLAAARIEETFSRLLGEIVSEIKLKPSDFYDFCYFNLTLLPKHSELYKRPILRSNFNFLINKVTDIYARRLAKMRINLFAYEGNPKISSEFLHMFFIMLSTEFPKIPKEWLIAELHRTVLESCSKKVAELIPDSSPTSGFLFKSPWSILPSSSSDGLPELSFAELLPSSSLDASQKIYFKEALPDALIISSFEKIPAIKNPTIEIEKPIIESPREEKKFFISIRRRKSKTDPSRPSPSRSEFESVTPQKSLTAPSSPEESRSSSATPPSSNSSPSPSNTPGLGRKSPETR